MKHRKKSKHLWSLMLIPAMVMVLGAMAMLVPGMTQPAYAADPVSYMEASWNSDTKKVEYTEKNCDSYTVIESGTLNGMTAGWYVLNNNLSRSSNCKVSGEVNIILCDGKTLEPSSFKLNAGATLNIYGQSEGTGSLITRNYGYDAAAISVPSSATLNIHGGTISASTSSNTSAIGGYLNSPNCGTVTIYGGTVTADAASNTGTGAGIGGSYGNSSAGTLTKVTIYGGEVTAKGGKYGAGIGSGSYRSSSYDLYSTSNGTVEILGGTVNATGGQEGAGIGSGSGRNGSGGTITISGGVVNATGGDQGAGIGGGAYGNGGTVTISGGEVNATGGQQGAGIGGGGFGTNGGTVTINGGKVTAIGGDATPSSGYKSPRGIGLGIASTSSTTDGTLTLGTGVNMSVSADNVTWTTYNNTRERYMKSKTGSDVTLTGGGHATADPASGVSQSELTGAMTTVTYTVNSGYYFAPFDDITNNGITASRTNDTTVTVSGTPTGDASITIPDAVAYPATAPTISSQPQDLTMQYGDTSKSVSVAAEALEGHTFSYQWYANTTNSSSGGTAISGATDANYDIPSDTNVGTKYYYCVVTATRTDNGQKATTTSSAAKVTVNKADAPALTDEQKPTAKTGLTYTGSPQALVNAPAGQLPEGYTMQYSIDGSETWSATIPSKTNVGEYTVHYKAIGDSNHSDTEPATVTATISAVDKTALGTAITAATTYYNSIEDVAKYTLVRSTLSSEIETAQGVKNNDNVTEQQVSDAVTALNNAVTQAEAGVAAADLSAAISAAENKQGEADYANTYTEATRETVATALAAAKAVNIETASTEDIVAAATALNDAVAGLVEKSTEVATLIGEIPNDPTSADGRAAVQAARAAYDALSDAQKAKVPENTL
ncbi:MAG: hypothetical protein IJI20_00105, partial [Firmicutes bacterium]|nr:hypothetical protein [Bacillota bacterium]